MGSRLASLFQLLLVFAAIGQLLCVESEKSTQPSKRGGIHASLIHRDDYFGTGWFSQREKMERDVRRSNLRVQSLVSRTKSAGAVVSPGGNQDLETPLSDGAASEYLMEISLGTPAQTFVAVADTGSDLTWLQCGPCVACDGQVCGQCNGSVFDNTKSSTYAPISCSSTPCLFLNETGSFCPVSSGGLPTGCDYGYFYGDGSTTLGNIAQDTISILTMTGGIEAVPNYEFGCSHNASSTSDLLDATDGLVGLGRGNISFPSQLGSHFGNIFGYCLVNRSSNIVDSSPLFFGSDAVPTPSANGPQIQYTPMNTSQAAGATFYYAGCTGMSLNGKDVSTIPPNAFDIVSSGVGGIIFDSGTTFTTLWDQILNPLVDALVQQISNPTADTSGSIGFPLCYDSRWSDWVDAQGKGVPIISFQFANTTGYALTVDTAWIQADDSTVCLQMQSTTSNFNIFGNTQQVGYHIVYDLGNEQIGFVQGDCAAQQSGGQAGAPGPAASIGPSSLGR